jgi:TetR/AcrR family transcriptional regulator
VTRAEITREKILSAAEEIFAEKGIWGSRVDEIAERAGVNKRMLYAYFGNKEQLYVKVLEELYLRVSAHEGKLSVEHLGCVEAIPLIVRHYFDFLRSNRSFVKLVMWENLNEGRYLATSEASAIRGVSLEGLRRKLEEGIRRGEIRPDVDLDAVIVSFNMFCFSYFSNQYTFARIMQTDFESEAELRRRCAHVSEMLLRYLLPIKE